MSLVRILLGLVALASISSQAGATRLWKGGAGVVASTCSAGDFFTAVDGSGNFTCATPAGSGDITAVGDCASGACFSATSGNNSLIFEGATADTFETTLTTLDPSADATVSLPKRTGTLALEKVVNLYDYAACDGTDEATEIQAAITAACALGPGGTLYVPADTCVFASTLTLCSGLAITGSDSTERVAYGTAQPHELSYSGTGSAIDAQSLSGVRFAGLLLRATSGSFAGPLIDADSTGYLTIDRVMMTAATQAGAATCALLSINDGTDVIVRDSAFYRCGYAIYGRVLSSNYANVVTLAHNAFYQAEVCSVQNPGDAWTVLGNKWQQQGASDDESYMFCHGSGICSEGFNFTGNMVVDQPASPTNAELTLCGSGFNISGNFIGGGGTQDGILFDEECSGCSVQGNWLGALDEGIKFSGTGSSASESVTILGNDYATVSTTISGTKPNRSIMQESTNSYWNETADIWLNVDTDASTNGAALVIGSNAPSSGATHQYDFTEAYVNLRKGNDARFYETDDSNYVQVSAPTLAADWTLTLPTTDGATNDLLYNTDGAGTLGWRTPNAGTDITADLEEETHATEHSLGGTDPITVTNLASACTNGQVLGGTAGGTGVECQADVDTNTNASTICAGTTTYLDGEGNCDDLAGVYLPLTGGTLSGPLLVNSSITGSYASSADAIDFSNTYTLSAGSQTINPIDISPTATLSTDGNLVRGLNLGGSYAVGASFSLIDGIFFAPTVAFSDVTNPVDFYRVSAGTCATAFTSSTASGPLYQDCWVDISSITYSGAGDVDSTRNPWAPIGFLQASTVSTSGTGDLTIAHYDGLRQTLTLDAGNASSILTVSNLDVAEGRTPGCTGDNCGPGSAVITNYSIANADFTTALDTGLTITNAYGLRLQSFNKATNNYSLYSDTATTLLNGGVADIGDNIADLTTNTTSVLNVSPTVDISSTGTLNGFLFAPTTATSSAGGSAFTYGVRQTPAMTFSSGIIPAYVALGVDGTASTSAISSAGLGPIVKLLDYTATWGSSTASGIPVTTAITISDNPLITSTATSGSATVGTVQGMTHAPRVILNDTNNATGGVTALTVTEDTAYNVAGTYTETSGDLVITARTGLKFNQYSTSGSPAVTAQYGVDIAALSGATTNVGIRNADTTVYTPCVDDISGNTDYMVAKSACTAINLTAGGVRDFTVGTDQIADGYDGQIIYLFFSGSNSVAFNDGDNVNLAAAGTMTMSAGDTLTLLFSSTRGEWLELGRADN